jgi:hydrogenase expression/formation protein HypE
MKQPPRLGKIDEQFFSRVIQPHLGAHRSEVLVGPHIGHDNAIVRLSENRVLAITTDPLTFLPALGPRDSAWISVHLLVSDLATSALPPAYAVMDLNLPPDLSDTDLQIYWETVHREFSQLGVAIIAGHTGRYEGCGSAIIGSGTLIAVGSEDQYLAGNMAQIGDRVILTKSAMVATTGLLACVFPETVRANYGAEFLKRAQQLLYQYPVIEDVRAALSVGIRDQGVTSLHDTTEGGVLGALRELAVAAQCGITVALDRIPTADETRALCELLEIDPYISLSEGSLLISVRPHRVQTVMDALSTAGISATVVAELRPPEEGLQLRVRNRVLPWPDPREDPYWRAYSRAVERGWR